VQNRARNWIAARRSDPVPVLFTAGGCLVSAAALIFGAYFDWRGVVSNVTADLILVGPALFLSNIVVMRIQRGRARARIAPLLRVIAQLLHWAVPTAKQALDILSADAQLDMPREGEEQITLAHVESALADAVTRFEAAIRGRRLPATLVIPQPLTFPRFGAIRSLVQQADQSCPMPWSIAAANIAEDWAERCGVEFVYSGEDGASVHRRVVGLSHIEEESKGAVSTTRLGAETYLQAVRGCLYSAHRLAHRLAGEAPAGLLNEARADNSDATQAVAH
jgi:hypothetical protein